MTADDAGVPEVDPLQEKPLSLRITERLAQVRAITWFLVNVGRHVDPLLMRISGGRLNLTGTRAIVVLHHVGAKTGTARQTPLVYFTWKGDVVLVASSGGAPRDPAWLHNVRVHPDVELWVGRQGGRYRARVASPEQRAEIWPIASRFYSGFARYQDLAGEREIPVVLLTPQE